MENGEMKVEERKEIVICTLHENDTGRTGSLILDPELRLLHCEICNSYSCFHIFYAMRNEQIRKERKNALRRICKECSNYNLPGAKYCDECGSKMEVVSVENEQ